MKKTSRMRRDSATPREENKAREEISALTVCETALEAPAGSTPAECIRFDLGMANHHAALSLNYLARAGWRLASEKQGMAHGAWIPFCRNSVGINEDTANRYIDCYQKTVGQYRIDHGQSAMVTELTDKMISVATVGLEYKTATQAMMDLGIIKRPKNWGGEREGAGRKPKDAETEAAELAAIPQLTQREEAAAIWTRVMCMIDKTSVLDAVPLLPQKAAKVCYDRLSELAKAMKSHLEEF